MHIGPTHLVSFPVEGESRLQYISQHLLICHSLRHPPTGGGGFAGMTENLIICLLRE